MTIRTRVALWFVLILAVVLGLFSYATWQLTLRTVVAEVQRDVRQRAALTAALVHPGPQGRLRLPTLGVFSAPDTYLQVRDPRGAVLASSANLGRRVLPLDRATIAAGRITEIRLAGVPVILAGQAVSLDGRLRAYVLVGRSASAIYLALARLRGVLYPGALVALVVAGLAGWLLVWRALRPLEHLTTTAAAIAASRDHTRRLERGGTRDELSRLSHTINAMLAALDEAHRQVQEVSELRRQFLADVSHELRTPLTIMLSSLDLIAKMGASDPAFQALTLADMRVEVERMARLVTQVLILARADAGAAVAREPLLLGDVLADACRQARMAGGGRTVHCDGVDALNGAVVRGSPDDLTQLFLILLDNAVKYTPAGGTVTVSAAVDASTVAVTVADTGIGIAEADLPHIFERFYRAANARAYRGMGLGLAIAQQVAARHDGRIGVESVPGYGSRFTVSLPLLNPVPAQPGATAPHQPRQRPAVPPASEPDAPVSPGGG